MTEQENILRLIEAAGPIARTPFPEWCARFAALVKAEAVVETREACAKVCMDEAFKMEREAQSALEEEDEETCGSNRAAAWILSACAREIAAMGATPSREGEA